MKLLKAVLTSLILILVFSCNNEKSNNPTIPFNSETPAEKAEREAQEKLVSQMDALDSVREIIRKIENDYGVSFYLNERNSITANLSELYKQRFDLKINDGDYLKSGMVEVLGKLRGALEQANKAFENEDLVNPITGKFYASLSSWLRKKESDRDIIKILVENWLLSTTNIFHICREGQVRPVYSCVNGICGLGPNIKTDNHRIIDFIRKTYGNSHPLSTASCDDLFESIKEVSNLDIKIETEKNEKISLEALRGLQFKTLALRGNEGPSSKVTLGLEGLEKNNTLEEFTISNIIVSDLGILADMETLHSVKINFPNMKNRINKCPTNSKSSGVNEFCKSLGY